LILCPGINTSLRPLSEGSSHPFHVRIETDPVFKYFVVFGIVDDEQVPKTE
jgi:hypothetical protein